MRREDIEDSGYQRNVGGANWQMEFRKSLTDENTDSRRETDEREGENERTKYFIADPSTGFTKEGWVYKLTKVTSKNKS